MKLQEFENSYQKSEQKLQFYQKKIKSVINNKILLIHISHSCFTYRLFSKKEYFIYILIFISFTFFICCSSSY